jgi:hypothetical protein
MGVKINIRLFYVFQLRRNSWWQPSIYELQNQVFHRQRAEEDRLGARYSSCFVMGRQ